MDRRTYTLEPVPPYDFALTAGYLTYFRGRYGTDALEDGVFQRLLDFEGALVLASARSRGSVDAPKLEVALEAERLTEPLAAASLERLAWMLNVRDDLSRFHAVALPDVRLRPVVEAQRGLHPPLTASVYEAIILAILGQQVHAAVAAQMRRALIEAYGPALATNGTTYRAFPRPETLGALDIPDYRALKFSTRKAEYIRDISRGVAAGSLDLEGLRGVGDAEAVRRLVALRGVGDWTAHWLLIRALGRPDGFPTGDLALRRTMAMLVNNGQPMTESETLAASAPWAGVRTYVTVYLFAAARSGRIDLLTGLAAGP